MKEFKSKVVEYFDNSKTTIRAHSVEANQKLSEVIQSRLKIDEKCCDGMLLYEDEKDGDGLKGKYFDNEQWLGAFQERIDETIDFKWTGASPKAGINKHNFSVKWEGFLAAPFNGEYTFFVECDDGVTVSLNGDLIIAHNIQTSAQENASRTENWMNHEIAKKADPTTNHFKGSSKPVHLTGGTKFKIVVSYYHSIHDDFSEGGQSFMKLSWATDEWQEIVIPKKYLYTINSYPPLKITEFPPEEAVIRRLLENDLAFKNAKTYILQDIPKEYVGAPTLKWNTRIKSGVASFHINAPNVVYVAHLAHYPNPFPDDFENTQQSMSLLQIEAKANKNANKFIAKKSGMLNIFKKTFPEGQIIIPLKKNGLNINGVPLVMWFGYDNNSGGPVTCGGNELNISNSNGPYYHSCKASSEYLGSNCSSGFNERMDDTWGNMWYTRGEGIGAWVEVKFRDLFLVTKVEIKDRKNPLERNSKIELMFDDGSKQNFDLRNTDDIKSFRIEPIKTSSIRITIKGVYGTINNGGAFKIIGVKCSNIEKKSDEKTEAQKKVEDKTGVKDTTSLPSLFRNEDKETIRLKCKDSISNSKAFKTMKMNFGTKVLIYCSDTCVNTDFTVYGDLFYSKDSAICKSAFHSQKLSAEGGKVWMIFQNGRSGYRSQMRNGIRSDGKSRSDITITFEGYIVQEEIISEAGSKIDIVNPNGTGWVPAVIMEVDTKDTSNKRLKVNIEGVNGNPITLNYPDTSKILPCGDKIKNRECKSSRRNLNKSRPIKFRFMPESYTEDGDYIPENGKKYGETGKAFGWSKDMSKNMKQFNEASKQELHSLVEFLPSPISKLCSKPGADCSNVNWSAKVGPGLFFVRLYVGDPNAEVKADLMVNDKFLAKDKKIEEDTLQVYEGVVESKNDFLVVTSKCEKNCDDGVSKLNAIEIMPYQEQSKKKTQETVEKQINCGHAFRGGRCDKGPDVVHCLYDDPSTEVAGNCTGSLIIMAIPNTYQCKDQIGKYKCLRKVYKDEEECKKYCVNNCNKAQCIS